MNRGARLRRVDALLLAGALALFALCFALNVREQLRGGFVWLPVHVSAAPPGGYPSVRSFWSEEIARASGLAVGDEMLALARDNQAAAGVASWISVLVTMPMDMPNWRRTMDANGSTLGCASVSAARLAYTLSAFTALLCPVL